MRLTVAPLLLAMALGSGCSGTTSEAPKAEPETEEIALFNGKDLSRWQAYLVEPDAKKEDVWQVEGGLLICQGDPLGYLYTDQSFTNFKIVVEWRWAPGTQPGNSGVLMRINGEPQGIPRAIEAQLKSGDAGDLYGFHGMQIEGAEERMSKTSGHELLGDFIGVKKMFPNENPPGDWNRYEITLDESHIAVKVNGKLVNEATGVEIVSGPIGLQSEGGIIHFRTVKLTPLS